MLESIYIVNFAIIDRLEVDFLNHMTVLTGETGAGKSIIIDAIGQLMGNRSQTSFIKAGKDECFIEGVFTIAKNSPVLAKLKEFRIEFDDKLVVSKSFNRDNRTVIKIKYRNVSKMVLQSIMSELIDIHSQFETHSLFDSNNHLDILNHFIGSSIESLNKQYSLAYRTYREINRDYQKALNEELSDEQLEYYQRQLDEINSLDLDTIDEDSLDYEKKQLQEYEKIKEKINNYRQYINGEYGVLANLNNAVNELEAISDNPNYSSIYEKMYDLYYNLMDLDDEVISEFNSTNFDEYRLNEIQEILFKLNRLKRKYGPSISTIKEAKKEIEMKIATFNNRERFLNDLKKQLSIAFQEA